MTAFSGTPGHFRLISTDTVDSTNEEAKRLALGGAEDRTLIWAQRQSAGKGRRGRTWQSKEGNLYCSFLFRPDCSVSEALEMSYVAAVSCRDAIFQLLPAGASVLCKWPNDVLVNGRKVAGILLESSTGTTGKLNWMVVGLGINVENFPTDVEYPATSLKAEKAAYGSVKNVLDTLCVQLAAWHSVWEEYGFGKIREAWLAGAAGIGEEITVRLESGLLEGTFFDLDASGALVLQDTTGYRKITSGDVFLGATRPCC